MGEIKSFMHVPLCIDCAAKVWTYDHDAIGPQSVCSAVPDATNLGTARRTCRGDLFQPCKPKPHILFAGASS